MKPQAMARRDQQPDPPDRDRREDTGNVFGASPVPAFGPEMTQLGVHLERRMSRRLVPNHLTQIAPVHCLTAGRAEMEAVLP